MPLSDIKSAWRIFATRAFARQNKKIGLTNAALCKAVSEIAAGLNLADDFYALDENGLAKALGAGAMIEVQDDETDTGS